MRGSLREVGSWAVLPASLSLIGYGLALQVWPDPAGRFFSALLGLDAVTLHPLHGWATPLAGLALWLAASYAAAAAGWALWRRARHGPHTLPLDAPEHLALARQGRGTLP